VPIRSGIVTLSGYGIKVAVDRRHLSVSDGVGRQRRAGRFAKATSRTKRLVVIAQTGFVTLEALRWLHDAKAAFIQLDHDGSILMASIVGLDDARLRRAQALIPMTEHRLAIAREVLEAKLKGQLAVLDSFGLDSANAVRGALARLDRADRMDRALIAEAQAAEAYWDAWAGVPMTFAQRDRVPDHWRTFGARRSPLTFGPRAGNPLNAILNYLYTLLEVETRIALIGRGLDPGLALFHCDEANRQSLAADVMEPVRPHVDAFVLNIARTRTFSAKDFAETREGVCRLASPLAQELAPTMATWAKLVAPYAEAVARHVARLAKNGLGMEAPIGPKPSIDRARVKVRVRQIAAPVAPKAVRSVPIATAKMPAAVAAPSSRSASVYSAINACRIGARRRSERLSRASAPRVQLRSQRCAQRATIPQSHPRRSAVEQAPPQSSAKPLRHGAMMGRSMAWTSGAIFCRSCNACRCA
jgi:CRISPR-associated endonuclease Cas1